MTCIVSIMDKVNQEYGHQCVTHMYLYVQWYTARVDVMQLLVARDYKETSFVHFVHSVMRPLNYRLGIYGLKMMCVSKVNYYMHN